MSNWDMSDNARIDGAHRALMDACSLLDRVATSGPCAGSVNDISSAIMLALGAVVMMKRAVDK